MSFTYSRALKAPHLPCHTQITLLPGAPSVAARKASSQGTLPKGSATEVGATSFPSTAKSYTNIQLCVQRAGSDLRAALASPPVVSFKETLR